MKPAGLAEKIESPRAARNRAVESALVDLHHRATLFAEASGTRHDNELVATHEHQGWSVLVKIDAQHTIKQGYPKITAVRPGHSIQVEFPIGHQFDCTLTRDSRSIVVADGKISTDNGENGSQPADELILAIMAMIPKMA